MIAVIDRWLGRAPVLSEASMRDAAAIAALHAKSFQRGWTEQEIEQLLRERSVLTHRAMRGRYLAGFVMSRGAAGESEILTIAVAGAEQGRGLARQLLELHLRRLVGLGCQTLFLEVDEDNAPARKLYNRAGFREVGRREAYYGRKADGKGGTALVLRRDLA